MFMRCAGPPDEVLTGSRADESATAPMAIDQEPTAALDFDKVVPVRSPGAGDEGGGASGVVCTVCQRAVEADAVAGGLAGALAVLTALTFALPVLTVASSLPGGLISAAIIGFGMHQAWRMTGVNRIEISGPYRIGAAPAPA